MRAVMAGRLHHCVLLWHGVWPNAWAISVSLLVRLAVVGVVDRCSWTVQVALAGLAFPPALYLRPEVAFVS